VIERESALETFRCDLPRQLAWRFLLFQKDSALAQWYRTRTEDAGRNRKTMIVALARKLLTRIIQLIDPAVAQTGVLADWIAFSPLPGHASSSPAAGRRADWRGFAG
jgi:hypothetical protein